MKKFPGAELPENMQMAIWFNKDLELKGITEDNCRPANEIESWYSKKMRQLAENDETFFRIRLNRLYASKSIIVGVFDCMGTDDVAYGFLFNGSNQATSSIKKSITSGNHASQGLKLIEIPEEFVSEGEPYIYKGVPIVKKKPF